MKLKGIAKKLSMEYPGFKLTPKNLTCFLIGLGVTESPWLTVVLLVGRIGVSRILVV